MGLKKGKRVALHMNNGQPTVEGLLVSARGRELTLIGASIVEDTDRTVDLAHHVHVPREHVYIVQELG